MRGLDPRICRWARDGRIKSGHEDVVKEKLDSSVRWNDDEGCREPRLFGAGKWVPNLSVSWKRRI
jgi:hypothetical protein